MIENFDLYILDPKDVDKSSIKRSISIITNDINISFILDEYFYSVSNKLKDIDIEWTITFVPDNKGGEMK